MRSRISSARRQSVPAIHISPDGRPFHGRTAKRLGRPPTPAETERAIRAALAKKRRPGFRKIAAAIGVGVGTVQRVSRELRFDQDLGGCIDAPTSGAPSGPALALPASSSDRDVGAMIGTIHGGFRHLSRAGEAPEKPS